jgi:aspartyl-tRNA(Asn)/glutamyl-tRNA(Gln) amidotransferase subunit C
MKKEDIEHLASLARIKLTEEEKETFGKDISSIVSYVSVVSDIVSEDSDKAPVVGVRHNIFRQDEITNEPGQFSDDIIKEMPDTDGRFLKVKKILKVE